MGDYGSSAWAEIREQGSTTAAENKAERRRPHEDALEALPEPTFEGASFVGFFLGYKSGLRKDGIVTIQIPIHYFDEGVSIAKVARGTPLMFDVKPWEEPEWDDGESSPR